MTDSPDQPAVSVSPRLMLGADGGASRTRFVLLRRSPDRGECLVAARAESGPSNPLAVGLDEAIRALRTGLEQLWHEARLVPEDVCDAACLAISGCARPAQREPLLAAIRSWNRVRSIRFVHDAAPLLADFPQNAGIALIAGTGSFAWGRDCKGVTARAGGCGTLLGDEGSGYWIGLEGLRAMVRGLDGRGPQPDFSAVVLASLHMAGLPELIEAAAAFRKSQVAAVAEPVLAAAWTGDRIAQRIVESAVAELTGLVRAIAGRHAEWPRPLPVALGGGLVIHDRRFRELLVANLTASLECHCRVVRDAALAAARLAEQALSDATG